MNKGFFSSQSHSAAPKHFLTPQNEFGPPKWLGKFKKALGIGKTPPPPISTKKLTFANILTFTFGSSQIPVFFPEWTTETPNQMNFRWSNWSDIISLCMYVKHVLAPQNEFGIQKNTWSIYNSFGNWEDSPLPMLGKIPKWSRIYFESVPNQCYSLQ